MKVNFYISINILNAIALASWVLKMNVSGIGISAAIVVLYLIFAYELRNVFLDKEDRIWYKRRRLLSSLMALSYFLLIVSFVLTWQSELTKVMNFVYDIQLSVHMFLVFLYVSTLFKEEAAEEDYEEVDSFNVYEEFRQAKNADEVEEEIVDVDEVETVLN